MKVLLFLMSLVFPVAAQVSPIRLDVKQVVKNESSGKTNDNKKQVRSLTIDLQNNSQESFENLVVKYWFFARDMKSNDTSILTKGERKSMLQARGRDSVESETASSSYVTEHSEVSRNSGKGKNGGNNKGNSIKVTKVQASGKKITGYAVKVMDGDKVMAEYYSEPSLKAKVQ